MGVVLGDSIIDALRMAGMIGGDVVRVVIDARINDTVKVYTQAHGGPGITDAILNAGLERIEVEEDVDGGGRPEHPGDETNR